MTLVIIGGGQSGLAAAHAAAALGTRATVLQAGPDAAGSWPHYSRACSCSPPRGIAAARARVRAQARCRHPHRAALPGLGDFGGQVSHAAEYQAPAPFAGRRVVVVGGANSAVQIAAELAGVARVSLATRSPLRFAPQRPLGRDLHWWLTRTGIDTAPLGRWLHGRTTPVLDDGRYRAALDSGNPDPRAMFTRLDGDDIVWTDGTREHVDAIILATGYRPHLDYLAGTGALAADDRPQQRRGLSTTVPGLGYVGLEYQRSIASATVRGVGRDAERVVGTLLGRPARAARLRNVCCPVPAR